MITQGAYTFGGSSLHGDIIPAQNFQPQLVIGEFFGVLGEAHLLGESSGRDLTCQYMLSGFATSALLAAQIADIESYINVLTGTVTISGNISASHRFCTFLAYDHGPMFYDGSGVNFWIVEGRLRWRQQRQ